MTIVWLAIGILSVWGIGVLLYAYNLGKKLNESQQQHQQDIKKLRHELMVINSAAMGVGQRLISTEKKLKTSMEKQQMLEINGLEFSPYQQAANMADNGAHADELVDRFGLPEAEANLMELLKLQKESLAADSHL